MNNLKAYFDAAGKRLEDIEKNCETEIRQAAVMFAECFDNNGLVQLFGLRHGLEFSMELGYRAGGLMPFHQIKVSDLVLKGMISEEYASTEEVFHDLEIVETLLNMYNIDSHDLFMIADFSGVDGIAVECALKAREHGHKVIAVVNKKEEAAKESYHASGKKLSEVADLVIDNCGEYPDTVVEIAPGIKMNQLNTFAGNIIAQMITAETYRYLTEQGKDCPVLLSANVAGADKHNRAISDKYAGRWNSHGKRTCLRR